MAGKWRVITPGRGYGGRRSFLQECGVCGPYDC